MAAVICTAAPEPGEQVTLAAQPIKEFTIAVRDVRQSSQSYADILGITQWDYIDLAIDGDAMTKPQLRVARGQWRSHVIELIQPLAGESPVKAFLVRFGEGLFSIGVEGSAELPELFAAQSSQGLYGQWLDSVDTLGIYLKLRNADVQHQPWGQVEYASSMTLAPAVVQLGIVVDDVWDTAKQYQSLVGLVPWMVVDFKAPHVSDATYLGARGVDENSTFVQVAYGNWAGLQIELLAPKTGPSPHRDFLLTRGAGAHHLSLGPVADHDQWVHKYEQVGLAVQMQSDNGGKGRTATYMTSEPALGFVLELTRAFNGLGSLRPAGMVGAPSPVTAKR